MLSSLALFYLYLTLARTRVDLGREVAGSGVETGLAFRRQMRTEPTHAPGIIFGFVVVVFLPPIWDPLNF